MRVVVAVLVCLAALARADNLQQAADLLNAVLADKPGPPVEPTARLLLGYVLVDAKAPPEEAIAQFRAVAEQFPQSPEAPDALLRIGLIRQRAEDSAPEFQ